MVLTKKQKVKKYKFIREGFKSHYGNHEWELGKWYQEKGINICSRGFHCSMGIYQAFSYVQGEYLCEVEVDGECVLHDDKEVWQKMRVIKVYKWTQKDSVLFSIYAAELVLENFEKLYPNDKRPREAIEAAKKYVLEPTEVNRSAAWSAAWSAESAAWSATWSAESATWSAESAWSAAWSAESAESAARSAARSAESAAWSAARSATASAESAESAGRAALKQKLDKWMLEHVKNLKVVKESKR